MTALVVFVTMTMMVINNNITNNKYGHGNDYLTRCSRIQVL